MDNKKLVKAWHKRILAESERRLGRELTSAENRFITSRGGFIALEMIEDTVNALEGDELSDYLNSEASEPGPDDAMADSRKQMGQWIAFGIAIGVAIGAAMGNMGAGIAIGIALGAGIAASKKNK